MVYFCFKVSQNILSFEGGSNRNVFINLGIKSIEPQTMLCTFWSESQRNISVQNNQTALLLCGTLLKSISELIKVIFKETI